MGLTSMNILLLSSLVYADAQLDKAERIRLSEEIKGLEKRLSGRIEEGQNGKKNPIHSRMQADYITI